MKITFNEIYFEDARREILRITYAPLYIRVCDYRNLLDEIFHLWMLTMRKMKKRVRRWVLVPKIISYLHHFVFYIVTFLMYDSWCELRQCLPRYANKKLFLSMVNSKRTLESWLINSHIVCDEWMKKRTILHFTIKIYNGYCFQFNFINQFN